MDLEEVGAGLGTGLAGNGFFSDPLAGALFSSTLQKAARSPSPL